MAFTAGYFPELLILEDDVVRIEPMTEAHFEALLPIAMERQLWRFTSADIQTAADFKQYFDQALVDRQAGLAYPFVYLEKATGNYVGSTRFGNIEPAHKKLEIGWTWLSPKLHGTGFNRRCKFLLLQYGFETLNLNRIELKTSTLNNISQKAMQNIGAVKEGTLRRHMVIANGTVRDTMYFSFIKEEWEATKQQYFLPYL
ncbi:MAG: hypothetical protein RLY16_2581 [Bacteroidota bacterium]|jgi:RimJ/RimL family protein N-acetyltransferase